MSIPDDSSVEDIAHIRSHAEGISILSSSGGEITSYLLQTRFEPIPQLNERIDNPTIRYENDYLIVGQSYVFKLTGASDPAGKKVKRYEGYGLVKAMNSSYTLEDLPDDWPPMFTPTCGCIVAGDVEDDTCNSGGLGATSCSASDASGSCSVSCNSTYVACCNPTE